MICDYCSALKKYCKLHPFPCAVLLTAICMWLSTPVLLTVGSQRPIEYLPGSEVSPKRVRAGDTVYITRHYNRVTDAPVTIRRRMEMGDCATKCDRIDLPSSQIKEPPAQGVHTTRMHRIPPEVKPGVWKLIFTVEYETHFGRTMAYDIPTIEVEIIP